MKQTAVEWLQSEMLKPNLSMKDILNQAKEMEKQQKDKFAIEFYDWCNSIEGKYLIDDLKILGELNKNPTTKELLRTFKNKEQVK